MPSKLSTKKCIEQFRLIHGSEYFYDFVNYVNSATKIKIICKKHGVFEQTPNNHKKGQGCPSCKGKIRHTNKIFANKSKKIHRNGKYDYKLVNYVNNQKHVKIICKKHGIFKQLPKEHLRGAGCPKCAPNRKLTFENFVYKANKIHNNFFIYPKTNLKKVTEKIKIICPQHGLFRQSPHKHLQKRGCIFCKNYKVFDTKMFISESKKIHNDKFSYESTIYANSHEHVIITCPKHGEFKQIPNSHLRGQGCLLCGKTKRISEKHKEIFYFCKNKYPDTLLEKRIPLKKKHCYVDIFIPSKNLIIEYYGDYWHCNPKKYKSNYFHKRKKMTAQRTWKNDMERQDALENLGYDIMIIWESDYKANKEKILKSI